MSLAQVSESLQGFAVYNKSYGANLLAFAMPPPVSYDNSDTMPFNDVCHIDFLCLCTCFESMLIN
jgi:hypothetical protein